MLELVLVYLIALTKCFQIDNKHFLPTIMLGQGSLSLLSLARGLFHQEPKQGETQWCEWF